MIKVSTSGFSYEDWKGIFYPDNVKKQDQLVYFSRFFEAVELNYSFYTVPTMKGISGHLQNAPEMKFALKGHKCFSHTREYGTWEVDAYKTALEKLRESNALIAMLLQFPFSFHSTIDNLDYLMRLIDQFQNYPLAIEFRHSRWKNRKTYKYLSENNVTLVTTDAPPLPNLFRGGWEPVGSFSYIRLHGRNAEKWWNHDEAWERYNYLYSSEQIDAMAEAIKKLANSGSGGTDPNKGKKKSPRDVYIFFNNHWQAQGAINAYQLALKLGLPVRSDLPEKIKKHLIVKND